MKIALFNHSDYGGGAAHAVIRLHSALSQHALSHEVSLHVIRKASISSPGRCFTPSPILLNKTQQYLSRGLLVIDSRYFNLAPYVQRSLSLFSTISPATINKLSCDIVHLHWVQAEMLSVRAVSSINKPIVWTLHDAWPVLGCNHYPTPTQTFLDTWNLKRKAYSWQKPILFVCPSKWMQSQVQNSPLFSHHPTSVIPNAVPLDIFRPMPKTTCRDIFGIPRGAFVISFTSHDIGDHRKGFDLLISFLRRIVRYEPQIHALIVGKASSSLSKHLPCSSTFTGYLKTPCQMAQAYNTADIHIVPSRLDNLPQSATEAQSCGIPILAFNVAGLADTVEHSLTGYLAKPYDLNDLVYGFNYLRNLTQGQVSLESRLRAERLWCPERVARAHVQLYNQLIDQDLS